MDRRVAFARWLRDHLNAGIEDLFAREDQARLSAPEQRREQLREVRVDRLERLVQELTRFAIDLSDGAFQRRHRFGEILRLSVEIRFALAGLRELLERGEIHRTQIGNRLRQALAFAGERAGATERLQSLRQS